MRRVMGSETLWSEFLAKKAAEPDDESIRVIPASADRFFRSPSLLTAPDPNEEQSSFDKTTLCTISTRTVKTDSSVNNLLLEF